MFDFHRLVNGNDSYVLSYDKHVGKGRAHTKSSDDGTLQPKYGDGLKR